MTAQGDAPTLRVVLSGGAAVEFAATAGAVHDAEAAAILRAVADEADEMAAAVEAHVAGVAE